VTYALHLAEVEERDESFDMRQAKANTTEEEFRFWSKPNNKTIHLYIRNGKKNIHFNRVTRSRS
jgi:hypothetical protein